MKKQESLWRRRLNHLNSPAELLTYGRWPRSRAFYIADAQNQASDILGNATNQANEMVTTAQNKSREMPTAVNNYADDTLLSIDDSLYKALADVRRIRKGIEDTQNKNK